MDDVRKKATKLAADLTIAAAYAESTVGIMADLVLPPGLVERSEVIRFAASMMATAIVTPPENWREIGGGLLAENVSTEVVN